MELGRDHIGFEVCVLLKELLMHFVRKDYQRLKDEAPCYHMLSKCQGISCISMLTTCILCHVYMSRQETFRVNMHSGENNIENMWRIHIKWHSQEIPP